MSEYDSPWKEGMDAYFKDFMAFFYPWAHAEIDWERGYQPLDKELQQITVGAEVGRRVVDKLFRVTLPGGMELWVLVHVEVQTWEDADFPQRMYVYNYRVYDRYNHEVVSLAILADDNPNWRPDSFGYSRWGFSTGIQFPVVKLLDYAQDWESLERNPNPFAMIVLAHLKTMETRNDDDERHRWKVRLIKGLYERGLSVEDVRQLFRLIDWMMDLPEPLAETFWQEIRQYEKEKKMPFMTTPERLGLKKGLEEGLRQGIETVLELKFGAEGRLLVPEIRAIENPELLEAILQAARTASKPEDLRRIWAPQ